MGLRVRFFAALRDKIGPEIRIEWEQGLTGPEVLRFLKRTFGEVSVLLDHSLIAINGEYKERNVLIGPEDELAVLPPVSGG